MDKAKLQPEQNEARSQPRRPAVRASRHSEQRGLRPGPSHGAFQQPEARLEPAVRFWGSVGHVFTLGQRV